MTIIDFASVPPTPELRRQAGSNHLSNYDRIFKNSKARAGAGEGDVDPQQALANYVAMYEKMAVDYVVIRARDCETTFGVKVSNEDVAEFCRNNGARFIGIAGVDPNKGMVAIRELEYAVKELGLRGVNIQGFENKLPINAKELYPIYAKCIELDVPANIHGGMSFSDQSVMTYGKPEYLDEVMVHFPELKAIASVPGFPWVQELIGVAWRHKNVYIAMNAIRPKLLTVENSGYGPLFQYGKNMLQDQIVFGSNWPLQPVESFFQEIDDLPVSEEIKAKWKGDNVARLFELD